MCLANLCTVVLTHETHVLSVAELPLGRTLGASSEGDPHRKARTRLRPPRGGLASRTTS
jgi:hypothetical protein